MQVFLMENVLQIWTTKNTLSFQTISFRLKNEINEALQAWGSGYLDTAGMMGLNDGHNQHIMVLLVDYICARGSVEHSVSVSIDPK